MKDIPLGKKQAYDQKYSPDTLFPIARNKSRAFLSHTDFTGYDLWNAYEFSWVDEQGKPQAHVLRLKVSSDSENIVESKSLKLYLNSFCFKVFKNKDSVLQILSKDIHACIEGDIALDLIELDDEKLQVSNTLKNARCLDKLKLTEAVGFDKLNPELLKIKPDEITDNTSEVYTHLFRSVCPVTSQPDWASIFIRYQGTKISEESLLRYLLSFRKHAGFHEDCVERIYSDISEFCMPTKLSVYAAFTRRGGIDINPFRSNFENDFPELRLSRQ